MKERKRLNRSLVSIERRRDATPEEIDEGYYRTVRAMAENIAEEEKIRMRREIALLTIKALNYFMYKWIAINKK